LFAGEKQKFLFFAKFHFTLFREKMQNFREIENAKLLHTAKNSENFAKKKMRKFHENNENFAKNTEFLRTNEAFWKP